jgi:hypothetical protein
MSSKTLKETLIDQIPAKQEAMKKLKAECGNLSLGDVTVDQCIGGGHVEPFLRSLPKTMHTITQLSIGLQACQTDSKFAAADGKEFYAW